MKGQLKSWESLTANEIYSINRKHCKAHNCPYIGKINNVPCCDYLFLTGKMRNSDPRTCKKYMDNIAFQKRIIDHSTGEAKWVDSKRGRFSNLYPLNPEFTRIIKKGGKDEVDN